MTKNKENKEATDLSKSIFSWPVTKKMVHEVQKFTRNRKRFQLPPGGGQTQKASK